MMIQDLVNLAQIVSVFLTLVTLFFVWKELRNVERNQKASTVQNIAKNERELWLSVLDDEKMTSLMTTHLQLPSDFLETIDVSPANSLRLLLFFRQYENIYYQHIHGMLPENLWNHWRKSMEHTFSNQLIQSIFNKVEVGYSAEFKEFIKKDLVPNLTVFPNSSTQKDNVDRNS
jgi:hypothetical protein